MKLIVGLGNPGRFYANNRHNIGFMCLNHFAKANGILFDSRRAKARVGTGGIVGEKVVLAKPQTFVNLSGESVVRLVKKHNISLSDLIVIHDDLDLPLGKIRIRMGGRSGGHRGINSIIARLGSQDFIRIRVGIGRPPAESLNEDTIKEHVLSDFTPEEKAILSDLTARVSEAIVCLLTDGLTTAMNKYN